MLSEKSLVLPKAGHLAGKLAARSVELFVVGSAAAALITGLHGGYCDWAQKWGLNKATFCVTPANGIYDDFTLGIIGGYFLYLFIVPLHQSHDGILVFSHHNSWVHAVSNWLTRLKGIVNPQTDFQELINAAGKVTHGYEKNNLLAFVGIMIVTLLFGLLMFSPWVFAYLANPNIRVFQHVIFAMAATYCLVIWSFIKLGYGIWAERSHADEEHD